MILRILAAIAALTWPHIAAAQEQQQLGPALIKAATPCAVAEAIAVYWMKRGPGAQRIFDAEPMMAVARSSVAKPKDMPAGLFSQWRASPATGLLDACPAAASTLERFGPLATPEQRATARGVRHGPYLIRIGAPFAAKSDLIIDVASQCAGLCGYGGVLHYRKTAKGWVRMAPLAVMLA